MSDLCVECIEMLRNIAAARMGSRRDPDKNRGGGEDYFLGRKVELEPEVSSISSQIREKLRVIETYGGKEGKTALAPLVDGYNTAIGRLEGRDYVLALDNAILIVDDVNSEYDRALANTEIQVQAQ
jgi:hypothetical protein